MMPRALNFLRSLMIVLCAGVLSSGCMSYMPKRSFDAGPLASRDTTIEGNDRFRMLGPLVERQQGTDGSQFGALRPLTCRITIPERDIRQTDVLWPIWTSKQIDNRLMWVCIPSFGLDFDVTDEDSRERSVLFPFFVWGTDKDGGSYGCFFPFYGNLHEFLGRDRLKFVMFPFYMKSRINDITTRDYLWPFFSRSKGDKIDAIRIFPFYGHSTWEGKWDKKFIMWPVWTQVKYDYHNEKGGGFILFPFYGHVKSGDKESWMVIPPFFRWSYSDTHTEVNLPYPFIQYETGECEKLYFWPLWGKKSFQGIDSWFAAWPVIRGHRIERPDHIYRRFAVFPLFYTDSRTMTCELRKGKTLADVDSRHTKLWPLFSYKREGKTSRTRVLALWPFRDRRGVEKNLAPFWTLYSRTRIDKAVDTELLWGLYKNRLDKDGSRKWSVFPLLKWRRSGEEHGRLEWNFFYGLCGYKRDGLKKRVRMLYFIRF